MCASTFVRLRPEALACARARRDGSLQVLRDQLLVRCFGEHNGL